MTIIDIIKYLEKKALQLKLLLISANFRFFTFHKTIYFSIRPNDAGFTDQVRQFLVVYKLGKFFNLKYYHIPFRQKPVIVNDTNTTNSVDESVNDDIYDLIGFNQYFESKTKNCNIEKAVKTEFIFQNKSINDHKTKNLAEFLKEIRNQIRALSKRNKHLHIIFASKKFKFLILTDFFLIRDLDFDFKKIYFDYHKKHLFSNEFEKGKTKFLMHIRQGDTALIKTPWNSYIWTWRRKNSTIQIHEIDEIDKSTINSNISVSDFYTFYQEIIKQLKEENVSTMLFSDGFVRSFSMIFDEIQFSEEKYKILSELSKNYDNEVFKPFSECKSCKLNIGEQPKLLNYLIHCFLQSDVVVTGTNQRMMLKLYSIFFKKDEGPLVIVLKKTTSFDYSILMYPEMKKNFIPVNPNNFDSSELASKIQNYLISKIKS